MAQHQADCEICRKLDQCRSGDHPGLIAEMETGFAVLGDSQYFRGYSLLLCKTAATELFELPDGVRARFLEEMVTLSRAVQNVLHPHKLNYECLGNQVHHLHWHIFPRYLDEPDPLKPVWTCMPGPDQAPRYALDPERHIPLISALREELSNVGYRA